MYRKGVAALIRNTNKEFLLVNLNSFEDRYFAIPGGGIEEGETLEQAVYREVQEELGISKELLTLVGTSDDPLKTIFTVSKITREGKEYIGSEKYFFGFDFTGGDDRIHLQPEEVRAYKWVSFDTLGDYLLFDNQLVDTVRKIGEVFSDVEYNKK
jgi:putative (di)nucleoside polyphosphate hydrolase